MTNYKNIIEELKKIDIRDVLNELNIPYTTQGKRVNFKIRDENTPSCYAIQKDIWLWRDFGDERLRGTVIDLWACVKNISFIEAVSQMQKVFLHDVDENETVKKREVESDETASVEIIVNPLNIFLDVHKKYMRDRCVYPPPPEIVSVTYVVNQRKLYGLGMKTLSGWVIRQTTEKAQKGEVAKYLFAGGGDISYWRGETDRLVIVEGMFDGASLRKIEKERNHVIILNSVNNYRKAIDFILKRASSFSEILLALDNDDPGRQTSHKIAEMLEPHIPVKQIQYDGKDLNEYLIKKESKKPKRPSPNM